MAKKAKRKSGGTKKKAPRVNPARKIAKKKPARKSAGKSQRVTRAKDGRPAGMYWPALSPYMTVRDAAASLEFYARAFGFRQEGTVSRNDKGEVMHAGMALGEARIMFAPQGMSKEMQAPASSGAVNGLSLYVYVPDVDRHAATARAAGANELQAPADQFWGDRIAIFMDADGYHWTFATHIGQSGAARPPE